MGSEDGYHAFGMVAFTQVLGMSTEDASKVCQAAVAAAKDESAHVYNYL